MQEDFYLNRIYQNGMVLQQKCKNCISGGGVPGLTISVLFRKKKYTSKINSDGKWKVIFNPGDAGGPDVLSVFNSEGEEITLTNVYVGEVWLCSGQSNMQLPMERLKYTYPQEVTAPLNEQIRMFTVPISYSFDGEKSNLPDGKWLAASPETILSFSGTSYFFAKKIQQELKVPVGIINASQGGSPIASWLSEDVVNKWPSYKARLEKCREPGYIEATKKKNDDDTNEWYSKCGSIDRGFTEKWNESKYDTHASWKDFSIPGVIDSFTEAGTVWFKKEFELTDKDLFICGQHKIHLWLGTIVDSDTVWVNGIQCGTTGYCYPPRRYEIPLSALQVGKNCITIRVIHCGKKISFEAEKPYFIFTDNVLVKPTLPGVLEGTKDGSVIGEDALCIDVSGVWKMREGCSLEQKPGDCFFEWEPTALYNSMLAPCFTMAVRGFVWYQGESDTGNPNDYEKQLSEMINLWRKKFIFCNDKKAPFIVVQLPNCGEKIDFVANSGWAKIRDAERNVAYKTPDCGLAVLIDAGEWNDLHPENKEIVGTRCAYEALRLSYGRMMPVSPSVVKVELTDDGMIITLTNDVVCKGKAMPVISAILRNTAGDEKICQLTVKAIAHKKIITMIPSSEMGKKQKIVEVRYAWSDSPSSAALYDKNGELPVVPFRVKL